MKYLGLDLGSRTLGVAISDSMGCLASIYDTYRFSDDDYESAANYIALVIKKENIETVVLGYPKHMNGDVGLRGEISEKFKEMIMERVKVNIILWDERLTTVLIDRMMISADVKRKKRKEKKDELAAVLILQSYLDSKH